MKTLLAVTWLLLSTLAGLAPGPGRPAVAAPSATDPVPIYAYYYIWFDEGSWRRAKTDYPVLGRYSSDQLEVMRTHARWARTAGIDGFIVSWKDTPVLSRRLAQLVEVADAEGLELAIMYQGLDFERDPLPVETVAADFDTFLQEYGDHPVFVERFGKPVMIWSGTWEFSVDSIQRVADVVGERAYFLASERDVDTYRSIADVVDGNAYYWSSVDPGTPATDGGGIELSPGGNVSGLGTPGYQEKLNAMGREIHRNGGLWFAPAAPGFDARRLGGFRVIDRNGGETLRRQLEVALGSSPDVLGVISWNEFSENTHIEPSLNYGRQSLKVLADQTGASPPAIGEFASDEPAAAASGWGNLGRLALFGGLIMISLFVIVARRAGEKHKDHQTQGPHPRPRRA